MTPLYFYMLNKGHEHYVLHYVYMLFQLHMFMLNIGKGHHITNCIIIAMATAHWKCRALCVGYVL